MALKIEKEAALRMLRNELARLNTSGISAKEYYHRQSVLAEIERLEKEITPPNTESYPTNTLHSPRGRTHEYTGKVVNLGGKRKVMLQEPKQYQPLKSEVGKSDTLSGYGEKRKRYVR